MRNNRVYAKELLKKMTLAEKAAQLSQTVAGYRCYERNGEEFSFSDDFVDFIKNYGAMGAISNILRSCAWTKKDWGIGIEPHQRVKVANMIQQYVMENSRLGIPVLIEVEANHGVQALGSEMFPTNIGMGCTFNEKLYRKVMSAVGKEIKLSGNHIAFITMLDLARDIRWGRTEEFFSEDPYLASEYAKNAVEAIKEQGVLACCKHYCATGDCFGGINTAEVSIGTRELYDIHLRAAEKAVKSGADVIMAAYNTVDGIPCHANKHLLKDVLRDDLGFEGIVISDGWGVERMINQMGLDMLRGSALALNSGIDLSLADNGAFLNLVEACEQGLVKEETIDNAVLRILEKKFELGLFDNPFVEDSGAVVAYLDSAAEQKLSYEAASESIVLLKNNGVLPLEKTKKAALFGVHADNIYYLLGDYTSLRKPGEGKTIKEVFENTFDDLSYTKGWDFLGDCSDFDNAVKIAQECDVCIVILGGSTARAINETIYDPNTGAAVSSQGFIDCGEGIDLADINLAGNQNQFIERLKETGKPVVSVLVQGRPYVITKVNDLSDAVLAAWYPGQQGAQAIADVITGKVNPSGKLSVSIPYSECCVPAYYNRIGEENPINPADECCTNTYADCKNRVLYPFGYGLSYSEFEYKDIKVKETGKNNFEISVTVKNNSPVEGKEVVQLYIRGFGNSVRRRGKELKGFKKVSLKPFEEKNVIFALGYDELKVFSANNIFEVEDARVELYAGSNPNLPLKAEIFTQAEKR